MAAIGWAEKLGAATKTCLVQDGKRKVHYTFDDGNEMVEEYDLRNYDILVSVLGLNHYHPLLAGGNEIMRV